MAAKNPSSSRRNPSIPLVLAAAFAALFFPGCPKPKLTGGEVHGLVYADVKAHAAIGGGTRRIWLPDINVYLKNAGGPVAGAKFATNLDGRYFIPHQAAGTYSVCWDTPGYTPGCSPDTVTIGSGNAYAKPIRVPPIEAVVFGRVLLKDGTPCRFLDPMFQVDLVTKVSLLDGAGTAVTTVRANNMGDYLIPKMTIANAKVRANCEASMAESPAARDMLVDLGFANSRPKVGSVVALDGGGVPLRASSASAALKTRALVSDPNGDPLHFRWKPTADGGGFASADADNVAWTLPASGGLHSMYVLVGDGKGGYARGRVDMTSDGKGILFTGTVVDAAGGAPVDKAAVTVNGTAATTNPAGFFSVYVTPETSRYVVNIWKEGYEFLSKVTTEGVVGGRYRLHKGSVETIDPKKDNDVTEKNDQRQRTRLLIPANSLVDSGGALPSGPLQLTLSTIDLHDPFDRWPGDGAGVNAGGKDAVLTPYGTVHIDVRDASGKTFNLKPGAKATVRMTVDPVQAAAGPLPASMPAWTYDRDKGIWKESGVFTRVGGFWEAKVSHFSELNVDVQKTGPAACVRIHTDATVAIPYNLRISVPATGSTAAKQVTKAVDNPLSAILRLPPTTAGIKLEIIDTNGNVVATPGGTVTFTSPAGIANHFPSYDYTECGAPGAADVNIGLTEPPPPAGGFLTYLGTDSATSADAYYLAIDPTGAKTTLTAWKSANGFGATGAGEVETNAAYLNSFDLGLGRFMNMHKKASGEIAYYVSNYGIPPNHGSADFAASARLPGGNPADHLIATVAMEYTDTAGHAGGAYTKFYVFNAAGNRVNAADLDGNGAKFVPSLCSTCHGGNFPGGLYHSGTNSWDNHADLGARFIAFDVESFGYSALDPSVTKAGQQANFNLMNAHLLDTNKSDAIDKLVHGWYGVAPGTAIPPGAVFDETWVPTGDWRATAGNVALYSQVVKTSCRACHTTRDPSLDWNTYAVIHDNGSVKSVVCSAHVMPQAQVTFHNFWLSTTPNRPAALANGASPASREPRRAREDSAGGDRAAAIERGRDAREEGVGHDRRYRRALVAVGGRAEKEPRLDRDHREAEDDDPRAARSLRAKVEGDASEEEPPSPVRRRAPGGPRARGRPSPCCRRAAGPAGGR